MMEEEYSWRSGVLFSAIEERCNKPDNKNRSRDEIDEKFYDRFAGEIRHPRAHFKEPAKKEQEWKHYRNGNVESAKPATAEQRECGCDERQERKSPNGRCPRGLEPGSRQDS
jgi:hypothetical protein